MNLFQIRKLLTSYGPPKPEPTEPPRRNHRIQEITPIPKKPTTIYKVVAGNGVANLTESVNKSLSGGWVLSGSMSTDGRMFYQPMTTTYIKP